MADHHANVADRGARTPKEFCEWVGIGMTTFYEQVNAGRLKIRKLGRRTLVTDDDAKAWLASLPTAEAA